MKMTDEPAKIMVTLSDGRTFSGNVAIDQVIKENSGVWAMRLQGAGYFGQKWEGDAVTFRFIPETPRGNDD